MSFGGPALGYIAADAAEYLGTSADGTVSARRCEGRPGPVAKREVGVRVAEVGKGLNTRIGHR